MTDVDLIMELRRDEVVREGDNAKDVFDDMKPLVLRAANEIDRLQAAHREIYEVWAGSEGLPCETASEAYLCRLIVQMKDIAANAISPPSSMSEVER